MEEEENEGKTKTGKKKSGAKEDGKTSVRVCECVGVWV